MIYLWIASFALLAFMGPRLADRLRPHPQQGVDFYQDWASARGWLDGLPVYAELSLTVPRYLGIHVTDRLAVERNMHPPTSVLLTLPFAWLDYPNATLMWNLLSLGAIAIAGVLIVRQMGLHVPRAYILPAVAVVTTCGPLLHQVHSGQINGVLLLLLISMWTLDRLEYARAAGVVLGLAVVLKLTPGLFLAYYLIQRRWRVVLATIAAVVGLSIATALVLGIDSYRSYVGEVLPTTSNYTPLRMNASLRGFWVKWFDAGAYSHLGFPPIPPLVSSPVVAAVGFAASAGLLLTAWGYAAWRARTRQRQDWVIGLTFTAMLLLSPVTWDYSFLLLALPITQLWTTRRRFSVALLLLVAVLWLPPSPVWMLAPGEGVMPLVAVSIQGLALIGLFILGWTAIWERDCSGRS